jgi:hypothetical protein
MNEVVAIVASWVMTTTMVFLTLRLDERRMTPTQRARAWPASSRVAAVVVFGVVCVPIHFGRTRRSFLGVLAGLGVMLAIGALASIPDILLELGMIDLHGGAIAEAILAILVVFTLLYVRFGIETRLSSVDPGGG